LLQLEYNGQKVIRQVFKAEEIYKGKYTSLGPDLLAVSSPGFDLKGSIKRKEIFGRSYLQACIPGMMLFSGQLKIMAPGWP
jgi:predicted AlkP superfamily phosphohydrolase/phosphomutase